MTTTPYIVWRDASGAAVADSKGRSATAAAKPQPHKAPTAADLGVAADVLLGEAGSDEDRRASILAAAGKFLVDARAAREREDEARRRLVDVEADRLVAEMDAK